MPHQNVEKDCLGWRGSWKEGPIEDTVTSKWKLGSLQRPMESIKFLVKLFAIVWTKAMDQNLVVSKVLQGAALQAVTKINWVGKFVKVVIWVCGGKKKKKKNKPVFPVMIVLCWRTWISLTSKATYLHFLCFVWKALGKTTLISSTLSLLMPSFPESSIFTLFVILYQLEKKINKVVKHQPNKMQIWGHL